MYDLPSWWYAHVIPVLRRVRQEDGKFRVRREDKKEEATCSSRGRVAQDCRWEKL